MLWKILLLVVAGLILILGIGKIILDAQQENPDLNVTRDLIITIVLAFLVGIYPIIDFFRPSPVDKGLQLIAENQKRLEKKFDELPRIIGEQISYKIAQRLKRLEKNIDENKRTN